MPQGFSDLMLIVFAGFIGAIFILVATWIFLFLLEAFGLLRITEASPLFAYLFAFLVVLTSLLIQNSDWPAYFK